MYWLVPAKGEGVGDGFSWRRGEDDAALEVEVLEVVPLTREDRHARIVAVGEREACQQLVPQSFLCLATPTASKVQLCLSWEGNTCIP